MSTTRPRKPAESSRRTPEGRPWKKGQSGNPGGRPAGIRAEVKKHTGDNGEKAIEALALIAWGTPAEITAFFHAAHKPNVRERLEAVTELLDRGFGRPTQTLETPGGDGVILPTVILHRPASSEPASAGMGVRR